MAPIWVGSKTSELLLLLLLLFIRSKGRPYIYGLNGKKTIFTKDYYDENQASIIQNFKMVNDWHTNVKIIVWIKKKKKKIQQNIRHPLNKIEHQYNSLEIASTVP
jgi:hypothetical protein